MENNLAYYKDNILSKIEKNREIEKALALIHVNYKNKKQLALKAGRFSSEILIDKDLMVDLLKRMKELLVKSNYFGIFAVKYLPFQKKIKIKNNGK